MTAPNTSPDHTRPPDGARAETWFFRGFAALALLVGVLLIAVMLYAMPRGADAARLQQTRPELMAWVARDAMRSMILAAGFLLAAVLLFRRRIWGLYVLLGAFLLSTVMDWVVGPLPRS